MSRATDSPTMFYRLLTRGPLTCVLLVALACIPSRPPDDTPQAKVPDTPRVEDRLPWHDDGVWLEGDIHIHRLVHETRGPYIAHRSTLRGLDFIVVSEHAQELPRRQPQERIAALRAGFPDILILAGMEWNVPGGDHATIVLDRSPLEWKLLEEFSAKFDRKISPAIPFPELGDLDGDGDTEDDDDEYEGTWGELSLAEEGLRWLRDRRPEIRSAVFLNHPSRKDFLGAREIGRLHEAGLTGVEAAAGHQRKSSPGTRRSIDRYEPFIAEIGGDYDTLLAAGRRLSLSAGSDFHRTKTSYLPGAFSRTFVYSPDRSPTGVLRGLEAGSTGLVLGRLVTALETRTSTTGFGDFARIGETLVVPPGAQVTYQIRVRVPSIDYKGKRNHLHRLEIISDCAGEPSLVKVFVEPGTGDVKVDYVLPEAVTRRARSCFLRARGRRAIGGPGNDPANADLLFYAAATRLIVAEPRRQP